MRGQFVNCPRFLPHHRHRHPLPPVHKQKRIAAELKDKMACVERLRNSTERQLEAIKALPQAVSQERPSPESCKGLTQRASSRYY